MIYVKDGVEFVNPLRVGDSLVYNPTEEQLFEAGYTLVPDAPVTPSSTREFSTLKIVRALGDAWGPKKNILIREGLYEQFNNAYVLRSDGPVMVALFGLLTDAERLLIESKCLADDELCPISELPARCCGANEFVEITSVPAPTELDENARELVFPKNGAYFKTTFTEDESDMITVIPPTVDKERPYVQWQLAIDAVDGNNVTQFTFILGNLEVIVTGNTPAEYPTQLFEFYYDGEQIRCTQRSLIEHVINYGSEEA